MSEKLGIFHYISRVLRIYTLFCQQFGKYTHTDTIFRILAYRIIVFARTLLCISIWQHNRGAHMQYNSKPGLHAQHRCIVIPASLYRVQDA